MKRTTSGNIGGGTFRIDNALGDIALTRRGIIVATSEGRVYDWLYGYIRPYEDNRYSVRHAESEHDFDTLAGKQRIVMAFIEDCFFDDRMFGKLSRIHRQYPKLRVILFSASVISAGMAARYVGWNHGSYLSLRVGEKEIRESLEAVFNGERVFPPLVRNRVDEYSRLPEIDPYLTRREIEIVRCIADGKTVKEVSNALMVSEHTVTNHLCTVYQKFGTRNRVEVLKLAVSKGILPVDDVMAYTVQS
jgi:DNA-binding NarL/FixJ family response regulator